MLLKYKIQLQVLWREDWPYWRGGEGGHHWSCEYSSWVPPESGIVVLYDKFVLFWSKRNACTTLSVTAIFLWLFFFVFLATHFSYKSFKLPKNKNRVIQKLLGTTLTPHLINTNNNGTLKLPTPWTCALSVIRQWVEDQACSNLWPRTPISTNRFVLFYKHNKFKLF